MDEKQLQEYCEAWNRHDIEAIMAWMTEDCIFETGGGKELWGTRVTGYEEVRARFQDVWESLPDIRFDDPRHFIAGDRGCTEWILRGTRPDGTRMEVAGCDLFTFAGNRIRVKNTFLKNRS